MKFTGKSQVTRIKKIRTAKIRKILYITIVVLAAFFSATAYSTTSVAESVQEFLFGKSPDTTFLSPNDGQNVKTNSRISPTLTDFAVFTDSALAAARRGHTATSINSGNVLIVGGDADGTAEIYNISSQTSVSTNSLSTARSGHTASLLADGRVLITGGTNNGTAIASTEIYDTATGSFSAGAAMNAARSGHTATVLTGGSILITGGDAGGSAEIYDSSNNSFTSLANAMTTLRSNHSAALLNDGRVFIVGGDNLSSGEIFNPADASFTNAGSMEDSRARALLRVLFDGKVQIIGGNDHRSMEIYDPAAGIFGAHAHVPPDGDEHANLINEIMNSPSRAALLNSGQTITELSNQALVVGGVDGSGNPTNTTTIYSSSTASVTTDVLDYTPGTTVNMSGRGFASNETVTITLHEDPHTHAENVRTIQADADGNFTYSGYAPEEHDLGVSYVLGVKGQTSGKTAQTTFHDGNFSVNTSGPTYSVLVEIFNPATNCAGAPTSSSTQSVTSVAPYNFSINSNTKSIRLTVQGSPSGFLNWTTASLSGSVTVFSNSANVICLNTPSASGSGVATANFSNVVTTTSVTSSLNPSTFGDSVTFTATVSRTGSGSPTGSVQFVVDGVNFGLPVTLSAATSNTSTGTSGATNTLTVAGSPHTVTANYTPTGSFNSSSGTLSGGQVVNKANQTITFGALAAKTYGDAPFTVSATGGASGNPVTFTATGNCTSGGTNGATITITGAGSCTVTALQAGNTNYNAAPNVQQSFNIAKATPTITWANPADITYGTALSATQLNATASTAGSFVYNPLSGVVLNAGNAQNLHVDFTPTDTANYNNASKDVSINVPKAPLTVTASNHTVTYGDPIPTVMPSYATFISSDTAAGIDTPPTCTTTYTASSSAETAQTTSCTGGLDNNYSFSFVSGTVTVNKANANCSSITGYNVNYDGASHTATGSCTGVGGVSNVLSGLDLSGTTHTDAGGYPTDSWTFTDVTGNYNNTSGTVADNINKAVADCSLITGYSGSYDAAAHSATGTCTGVDAGGAAIGGTLDLGASFTNVPGGTADWTFTGGTNYTNQNGSVGIAISRANAMCAISGYTGVYDGAAHGASGFCTGVSSESLAGLTLGGTFTNAPGGTASWVFSDVTGNYNNNSGTAAIVISKANAFISVTPYSVTYNGNPHTATGTAFGVGNPTPADLSSLLDLSGTTHTDAGTYNGDAWTFAGNGNYNSASGTVNDAIGKALLTVTASSHTVTYGDAVPMITPSYATFVSPDTAVGIDTPPTCTTTYTTSSGAETVQTTSCADGSDNNYSFSFVSGTVTVNKASSSVAVAALSVGYDGFSHPTTATVSGVGTGITQDVTWSYSGNCSVAPVNVAETPCAARADYAGDANHNPSFGTNTITITKAASTTTVSGGGTYVYDSLPHPAGVSVTGAGGLSLNPAPVYSGNCGAAPVTPAQTPCTASYTYTGDANHNGSTGSTVINITAAGTVTTVSVSPNSVQYSDTVTFNANISATNPGLTGLVTGTVQFCINGANFGAPVAATFTSGGGTASLTSNNQLAPASYTVAAKFTSTNANFSNSMSGNAALAVTREDARIFYTGMTFVNTTCATCSTATVQLSATVKDITAVTGDPAFDANAGDISKATLTFVNRDTNTDIATVPVSLVFSTDTKVGTAVYNWNVNIGTLDSNSYTVGFRVNGYYTRDAATDFDVVTISKPIGTNFITGGGHLVMSNPTSSAGQFAGAAGLKTNFGFNVKYNKSGTSLQGNVNVIVRGAGGKVYQIKGNQMDTLTVNNSILTARTAVYTGKCNLTDITDPLLPMSLGGGHSFQMKLTDKGEPGSTDTVGITVYGNNTGALLYSSSWNGTTTIEKILGGGNLVVR